MFHFLPLKDIHQFAKQDALSQISIGADFFVVLFRPHFMLVSEEYPMKTHKNQ